MTINCNGTLIDLSKPKVMGILNFTLDSFFDGGNYSSNIDILKQVEKMITEGADFIDVGTYSSRPNARFVSVEEESKRMKSVLKILTKEFPDVIYSIDTFRSEVAQIAIDNGGMIINDISAGSLDKKMMSVVGRHQVPYIMMHMVGTPQTMTKFTNYQNLIKEIMFYFSQKISLAREYQINDIIIDVGFGFSKNVAQNFELLRNLELFKVLELPNLVGISRKKMIYQTLYTTPDNALNGTTVLNTIALQKGANILRVHDVRQAKETIRLVSEIS